jgi:homoserine dehydrogenase
MRTYHLAFLGLGSVGRALARLLDRKADELKRNHGIACSVTGVATRRLGFQADAAGLDLSACMSSAGGEPTALEDGLGAWLTACRADVLFEMTSLNPQTGQPAMDYIRLALAQGVNVVTANKGPIVFGYRPLRDLARTMGKRFLFEATVMDGAPLFSLFREALPAARLLRFRGVLNSTTNFILTAIESGSSFEEAVHQAQVRGIAETDPSADIDGWDAAVKVCALAAVLMESSLLPDQVDRQGIRDLSEHSVRGARAEGRPIKLVCTAEKVGDRVTGRVRPEGVPLSDPLAMVAGTSSIIQFETDVLPGLTLIEHDPGPETTAYGLLADFLQIVRADSG